MSAAVPLVTLVFAESADVGPIRDPIAPSEIINDLLECGSIRVFEEPGKTRPVTRYVATRFMAEPSVN